MNWADTILAIVSFGFSVSTTIQLIKVIRTKSTKSFAWFSLIYNTVAFGIEAVIFTVIGFYATCIPFYYAVLLWGTILGFKIWSEYNDRRN